MRSGSRTVDGQLAGRLLLLCLLAVALWNPAIPWRVAPAQVIVLLDESLSMDPAFVDSAWRRVIKLLAALPADSRYSLVRFGAEPVPESVQSGTAALQPGMAVPRTRALDPAATDLEAALALAPGLALPGRPPLLLLVSDAGATTGEAERALRQAQAASMPVYLLAPGSGAGGGDARIDAMHLPLRSHSGRSIPLQLTLDGTYSGAAELEVRLDDVLVARRAVTLQAGQRQLVQTTLTTAAAGAREVVVSLRAPGDTLAANNRRSAVVNVDAGQEVLYLGKDPARAPVAESLSAGGWHVTAIRPQELLQHAGRLPVVAGVILDDIAVTDLSARAWQLLAGAVRDSGTGLLVLGGPHSFGAGGYRGSTLEELLPLTSEARDPEANAAVLFLVDKSGSMDGTDAGPSRFGRAREAVLGTAASLQEGDRTGLLAFDAEPRYWLPLDRYRDPVRRLEAAWRHTPAGGTRILPALQEAVARLREVEADQRLLVLVTDGFVAGEDFTGLLPAIADAGIDVITLALGKDPDLELLGRLSSLNDGALLHVHDLDTLPALMGAAVGVRRSAYEERTVTPRQSGRLPFFAGDAVDWPALQGYMVTRERPAAAVYLRSERGDPLLASWQAGAGRVTALPAGLGPWAAAWQQWPLWGRLLGGLVEWNSGQGTGARLYVRVDDQPGACRVLVDALGEDSDWMSDGGLTLALRDPVGRLAEIRPERLAPGRYGATLPVRQAGRYRISVRTGGSALQHEFMHAPAGEFAAAAAAGPGIGAWRDAGLVRDWPADDRPAMPAAVAGTLTLRLPLLLLALVLYGALLLAERFPPGFPRRARAR